MKKLSIQLKLLILTFFLLIDFRNLIIAGEEQKNKLNILPMWELIKSNLPTDEYFDDIHINSLQSQELVDWAKDIALTCLRGNASLVYSAGLSPPESAKNFANQMSISRPSHNVEEQQQSFQTSSNKQMDVEKTLLILDKIYDSVEGIPYFITEDEFSPNAPQYAPFQTILSSIAIRSVQTIDNYILPTTCSTKNTSFHKQADRSIFYNSLSAGLSSAVITHVSEGSKTDVLIDFISTLALQLHMVKSIASLAGLDTNDDAVRTLIYLCIVSDGIKSSITGTAKELAKIIMRKLVIDKIPASVLKSINKRIMIKLLSKEVGDKGIINLALLIPYVGELVTFVSDSLATYSIGQVSKYVFCPLDDTNETENAESSSYPGRIEL